VTPSLRYAVATPARDEAAHLARLASALARQTIRPEIWVIVENGSSDGTDTVAERLAAEHAWIRVLRLDGSARPTRGAPIVRSLTAAIAELDPAPGIFVSVDADVSFDPDYFERLLGAFAADPGLGLASGSAYEERGGRWRQRHVTGSTVWGATRAYRWGCLLDVLPFEERLGWDGIDEFKANMRGWKTRTLLDLPFRHHRSEGGRDRSRWQARSEQGRMAHYVGYRPSYLLLRAGYHAVRDPAALGLVWGYVQAAGRREPRCADEDVVAYVHRQQRLRNLPLRAREALRPRLLLSRQAD
jgi:biofilm PGA synthesis N-glycosyltransferase PgaC